MNETIIHIIYEPSFIFGGVGTYVRELAGAQTQKNSVYIVYIDKIIHVNELDLSKAHAMISNKGYTFIKKIYNAVPLFLREQLKLYKMKGLLNQLLGKQDGKSCILHFHSCQISRILPKKFSGKIIQTVHGYLTFELLSDNEIKEGSPKYNRLLEIEKKAYRKADINIAVDQKIADHIKKLTPEVCVRMHPNFVNENKFKPVTSGRRTELRKEYGIPDDQILCITTRRFEKKNGIPVLANAITMLSNDIKNKTLFYLIGNGTDFETVSKIVQGNEKVIMPGAINHSKISDFYNIADIFIIPSISIEGVEEATSISTLEAMSCENIVISSEIGGLKILIQNGVNGFLIKDNDPALLADKISTVVNNISSFDSIRKEARNTIINLYSLKEYTAFVYGLYSDIKK